MLFRSFSVFGLLTKGVLSLDEFGVVPGDVGTDGVVEALPFGDSGVVCGYSAGAVGLDGWTGVVCVSTVVLPSHEEHGTVISLVV